MALHESVDVEGVSWNAGRRGELCYVVLGEGADSVEGGWGTSEASAISAACSAEGCNALPAGGNVPVSDAAGAANILRVVKRLLVDHGLDRVSSSPSAVQHCVVHAGSTGHWRHCTN